MMISGNLLQNLQLTVTIFVGFVSRSPQRKLGISAAKYEDSTAGFRI